MIVFAAGIQAHAMRLPHGFCNAALFFKILLAAREGVRQSAARRDAQLAKVVVWTSQMQHQAAGQMPLHTAVYIMVRADVAGAEAVLTTCWVLTRLARRCRAAISLRRWQLARRCSSRLRRWTCTAMVRWCCCCRGCQQRCDAAPSQRE